jgi:osmotically-inducible protein OsmY
MNFEFTTAQPNAGRGTCHLPRRASAWAPRLAAAMLATALSVISLGGCTPLVMGGAAVGGVLVFKDRRSSGTQLDDQTIELKSLSTVGGAIGERGHVNVTAYNGLVLLTGEVPNDADRLAVQAAMAKLERVRRVVNELVVGPKSSVSERANDALLTTKVKATLIDDKLVEGNAFKVVTERGIVHLMGRVTRAELDKATQLVANVSGVKKVVRVTELITEAELAAIHARTQPSAPHKRPGE